MRSPFALFALSLLVLLLPGFAAAQSPATATVEPGDGTVLRIPFPTGWRRVDANEISKQDLTLTNGSTSLMFHFLASHQKSVRVGDVTHPVWLADRWASCWKQPLNRLDLPAGYRFEDTFRPSKSRGRYMASASVAGKWEAFAFGSPVNAEQVPQIRHIALQVLASAAKLGGEKSFGRVPVSLHSGRPLSRPDVWVSDETSIHLPPGWTSYDVLLPVGDMWNERMKSIDLVHLGHPNDPLVNIWWAVKGVDTEAYNRLRTQWKSHAWASGSTADPQQSGKILSRRRGNTITYRWIRRESRPGIAKKPILLFAVSDGAIYLMTTPEISEDQVPMVLECARAVISQL